MKTYQGETKWQIMKVHFDFKIHNGSKTKAGYFELQQQVNEYYSVHKKLSQFDSSKYLSKFHASWWKFGE